MENTTIREVIVKYRTPKTTKTKISSAEDVATFIRKVLPDNSREHFAVLYLDGSNSIIGYAIVFSGSANYCTVSPREIYQHAVLLGACGIVASHNHPSGNTQPSNDDKKVTTKLVEAGRLLDIKMLDHIIVTDSNLYSFNESGLI